MATYLVTGTAGFIGSRVTHNLLQDGHTVVGVDNLNDAYDVRLKHWRLARIAEHPSFCFHHLDICDRGRLGELFSQASQFRHPGFDAVINLAARAGVRQSVRDPWCYFETNTTGTLNLLDLCREHGVAQLVLASSSSLYGAHNPCPFREDADTDRPLSPYAASKKAAEALCYSFHALHGLHVTILRYFTVYGPAGRPDMSPFRFVQWISEDKPVVLFGDGRQSRDFTYVDDIASGTCASLGLPGYNIINLGSDQPVVLIDAIQAFEKLIGKPAKVEYRPRDPADVPTTWADISKAKRLLGWRPRTPFEDGIGQVVAWYQEQRDWAKEIQC
ncbi:MAG TPA: NAD-dependent epimerase/dehydratase family protein [Chloroflexota bacterium]|nr:NAD-dependent epimerase/dehydratase family protein [Chloroflexota bacterium]